MQLTPHFTSAEMGFGTGGNASRGGPIPAYLMHRAWCLCAAVLEPIRLRWGALYVTSGYRPADPYSQHGKVEAADLNFPQADRMEVFRWLLANEVIPVDQCIVYEGTNHLHISHTTRHDPRREFLVCLAQLTDDGAKQYVPWDLYGGRLKGA